MDEVDQGRAEWFRDKRFVLELIAVSVAIVVAWIAWDEADTAHQQADAARAQADAAQEELKLLEHDVGLNQSQTQSAKDQVIAAYEELRVSATERFRHYLVQAAQALRSSANKPEMLLVPQIKQDTIAEEGDYITVRETVTGFHVQMKAFETSTTSFAGRVLDRSMGHSKDMGAHAVSLFYLYAALDLEPKVQDDISAMEYAMLATLVYSTSGIGRKKGSELF